MIYGIGIDVIEIDRIRRTLARSGERFTARVFTALEQQYCGRQRRPEACYAVRWAAKEAFLKALGTGLVAPMRWLDIEVQADALGKPGLVVYGDLSERCVAAGIRHMHVSLSHGRSVAVAQVVLESTP